jgi:SAM-dependent methyltransferase
MRQTIKDFVSIAASSLPIKEPIFEFGSLQVRGQEGFADLRPLFPGREFVGADIRQGTGVDKVLDLHDIDLPSESVGTVLCLETLEHVEYPQKALEEIHRILKPDGIAVISSVMCFPIHDCPFDYWRFTPEAFRFLLKPFRCSFVGFAGDERFPHTVVGIGFKGAVPQLSEFNTRYERWQSQQMLEANLKRIAKLIIPPVFLPVFSRIYRLTQGPTRRCT